MKKCKRDFKEAVISQTCRVIEIVESALAEYPNDAKEMADMYKRLINGMVDEMVVKSNKKRKGLRTVALQSDQT